VLYIVTREALSNVRRHSKATAAVVSLECSEGRVKLIVQDNGVGIPEMCALPHGDNEMCFGISTMRNVTEQVGGSFLITNNDDGGAMVKASFLLTAARPK